MEIQPGKINDRWELMLPDFRCAFHSARVDWERGRLESCAELMRPGMTVVDVGAEHGDFTALYGLWVGETGTVIPVEPCDHYWPFIRETWEANGLPAPETFFKGFCAEKSAPKAFRHLLWPTAAYGKGIPDGGFLHLAWAPQVPRISLDDLLEGIEVHGIVIDVEGAEFEVLAGALETMAVKRPNIWVSVHEPTMLEWYNRTLGDIQGLMVAMGYRGELLPSHGEIETFWLFTPKE